ncbi:MAG TPA: putative porin [Chryseolinea sp.]|nr:putative porin [Chryseolinea sp.]
MPDKKKRLNPRNALQCPLFLRVYFSRFLVLILCLTICWTHLFAQAQPGRKGRSQILDDSTKQVYGPKSSRYYYENDVFLNKLTYHTIDTVIRDFHRFTYVQRSLNTLQDLGNIGTSSRQIFYQAPEIIGATSGFQSYDVIWDSEPILNYDTKSPYTKMYVILGGKGRSMTRASFSRNINPRWNFGFNFRALLVDKQVQRQSKGDRHVKGTYYDFYTAFQSKDSSYRVFANFRRNKLEEDEYGGIRVDSTNEDFEFKDYFYENVQPNLQNAMSGDLRMNFHLFHQYEIGKALQIYNIFDRYRQGVRFTDLPPEEYFYDYIEIDNDTTDDKSKFKYTRTEVGIKGNLLKLFYNGYYAIRDYSMTMSPDTVSISTSGVESYLGGRISLRLDSLGEVTGWGELQNNGNYRIDGRIRTKWFEASLKQAQYSVPLLMQSYRGSHDVWNNDFDNTNVTQVNGYLHYSSRAFSISPGFTFTRMGNYVFFKQVDYVQEDYGTSQTVLPTQTSGEQVIASPELKFSLRFYDHITFSSQTIYTKVLKNTDEAIQIPDLFINAQLAYDNIFFKDNLDMQIGVDFHYKSDYYALGYDVPVQQFYVQQSFVTPSFPLVDIFFNARIKKGRIFFKYNNLIQLITKQGYMPTPGYPGQRNIIDFGFDWSFYD